jgi:hypothetical protein
MQRWGFWVQIRPLPGQEGGDKSFLVLFFKKNIFFFF